MGNNCQTNEESLRKSGYIVDKVVDHIYLGEIYHLRKGQKGREEVCMKLIKSYIESNTQEFWQNNKYYQKTQHSVDEKIEEIKDQHSKELQRAKEKLESIKQITGWQEPVRSFMDEKDIEWKSSDLPPDYTLTDLEYLKGKTYNHEEGSLEKMLENLIRTWEMESSHKVYSKQHMTVDQERFQFSVNNGPISTNKIEIHNILHSNLSEEKNDIEGENSQDSKKLFLNSFKRFCWEVLEVFSELPILIFSWRFWVPSTGSYKENKRNEELIEIYGWGQAELNSNQQLCQFKIWFDQRKLLNILQNQPPFLLNDSNAKEIPDSNELQPLVKQQDQNQMEIQIDKQEQHHNQNVINLAQTHSETQLNKSQEFEGEKEDKDIMGKTLNHKEGSLELFVENLLKLWEMEQQNKGQHMQHKNVDQKKVGKYPILFASIGTQESSEVCLEELDNSFEAFPWEILKVFTPLPQVAFSWRHWGCFTGSYKDNKGSGELIEIFGWGTFNFNEQQQLSELKLYYDQRKFLTTLEGKNSAQIIQTKLPIFSPVKDSQEIKKVLEKESKQCPSVLPYQSYEEKKVIDKEEELKQLTKEKVLNKHYIQEQFNQKDMNQLLDSITTEQVRHAKVELEHIKSKTGWKEPTRSYMDNENIQWQFGKSPDYTLTDLEYLKGKTCHHNEGSLEFILENLLKTWLMECQYKSDNKQHMTVDQEGFQFSVNNGPVLSQTDNNVIGKSRVLFSLADQSIMEDISNAIPVFPFEVLNVFTALPMVSFSWRHWGYFTGSYKGSKGTGELINVFGYGMLQMNDKSQLCECKVYFDQDKFLDTLEGKVSTKELKRSQNTISLYKKLFMSKDKGQENSKTIYKNQKLQKLEILKTSKFKNKSKHGINFVQSQTGQKKFINHIRDKEKIQLNYDTPILYSSQDMEYLKGKFCVHKEGTIEYAVETLLRRWEIEQSCSKDMGFDKDNQFSMSMNWKYNALLANLNKCLHDSEEIQQEDFCKLVHLALPTFPWEVLKVFNGPPEITFTWRHWGRFTGAFKENVGNGQLIELYGFGKVLIDNKWKVTSIQVYFNQNILMQVLEGKSPANCLRIKVSSAPLLEKKLKEAEMQTNILNLFDLQEENLESMCGQMNVQRAFFESFNKTLEEEILERQKQDHYFTEIELRQIWMEILNGLIFLEEKGQYSGNINPRYILKTKEGRFKIINNILTNYQTHYQILLQNQKLEYPETYCFLSPKLFYELGKGTTIPLNTTAQSEVFSLGLTILEAGTLGKGCDYHKWNVYQYDEENLDDRLTYLKASYSQDFVRTLQLSLNLDEDIRLTPKQLMKQLYFNHNYIVIEESESSLASKSQLSPNNANFKSSPLGNQLLSQIPSDVNLTKSFAMKSQTQQQQYEVQKVQSQYLTESQLSLNQTSPQQFNKPSPIRKMYEIEEIPVQQQYKNALHDVYQRNQPSQPQYNKPPPIRELYKSLVRQEKRQSERLNHQNEKIVDKILGNVMQDGLQQ